MGEAPEHITLVQSPEEARTVDVPADAKLVWISQTTLSVDETMATVDILRERFPQLQDPPSDDICYATQNRQVAVKKIAPEADLVLVVGSANSSNSVRLVEVALEHGAKAAHRVDFAREVDETWFHDVATVGVTSGASVPENLVQDVLSLLADYGFDAVEEVVTAEEDLMFSLPKELRKDLKAAGQKTSIRADGPDRADRGHDIVRRLVVGQFVPVCRSRRSVGPRSSKDLDRGRVSSSALTPRERASSSATASSPSATIPVEGNFRAVTRNRDSSDETNRL